MKNINNEETKCIKELCVENPDIVLKTEFGIGHYRFVDCKDLKAVSRPEPGPLT